MIELLISTSKAADHSRIEKNISLSSHTNYSLTQHHGRIGRSRSRRCGISQPIRNLHGHFRPYRRRQKLLTRLPRSRPRHHASRKPPSPLGRDLPHSQTAQHISRWRARRTGPREREQQPPKPVQDSRALPAKRQIHQCRQPYR